MPRPLVLACAFGATLAFGLSCRTGSQEAASVDPSVDNARHAVDLRTAPPGGSEQVVTERESLLSRFRERHGREEGGAQSTSGVEVAAAEGAEDLVLPVAVTLPQDCGYADQTAPYGPIKEGTSVVLGRHREWQGNDNWASDMQLYVGREAVVRSLEGVDGAGCSIVRVDIDQGSWVWRVRDMSLPGVAAGAGSGLATKKPDPVLKARKDKTAEYLRAGQAAFALTLMFDHVVSGASSEGGKGARERTYVASDPPAFDPKLGLHVVYAREVNGTGWVMLGLGSFDPGVYHGSEQSASVAMAVHEGSAWKPDAPSTGWSLNARSRVDLAIDPGKAGQIEISLVASLRDNEGDGYSELREGYAVMRVPAPAKAAKAPK